MTPEDALKTIYNAVRQINTTAENHAALQQCYERVVLALAELSELKTGSDRPPQA